MYAQSLIQVRVDRPLKDEVTQIFNDLGIDVSTAIRMFLQRCKSVRGIPFDLTVPKKTNGVIIGLAKGRMKLPNDWYAKDKEFDRKITGDLSDGLAREGFL